MEGDQLVGATEIADRLDLAFSSAVHNWRKRHPDFPEPIARLQQALVWYWPDVEEWARKTGRYPNETKRAAARTPAPTPPQTMGAFVRRPRIRPVE